MYKRQLYKCDLIDDDDKPTAEFRKSVEDGTFVEYFVAKLPEGIADTAHAKDVYKRQGLGPLIHRLTSRCRWEG